MKSSALTDFYGDENWHLPLSRRPEDEFDVQRLALNMQALLLDAGGFIDAEDVREYFADAEAADLSAAKDSAAVR